MIIPRISANSVKTTLLSILIPLSVACSAIAEPFIIENGQPRAEIIIADKPARAAEFGAEELQAYLEKITGARLEIVTAPTDTPVKIYVGDSEHARQAGVTAESFCFLLIRAQSPCFI